MGTPLQIVAGLAGFLLLFGVGTFLFQAGCALANVPERSYFRSLPIYAASLVLCLLLGAALLWFAGRYDTDPNESFGRFHVAASLTSLLLTWLLSALLFSLLLSASIRKGLIIAGIELLLLALLAALVAGIVLVVLACVQIGTRPPPQRVSRSFHPLATTSFTRVS